MLHKIQNLLEDISSIKVNKPADLESFRLKYLSKKGLISDLFEDFRNVSRNRKEKSVRNLTN